MTKSELIALMAAHEPLTKATAEAVLDVLAKVAAEELADGETVTIPGIVKLTPKARAARTGRNPQTGAAIDIPAKTVVTAKVSAALAKAVA
ncbi:MAG: HU family DNA-binding protein [Paracoccus sp. (in: a-proteobacteria)]|nr:HU family DNA-binding protein [Paracoccus sp. (in: a-proteobacteria)]